MLLAQPPQSTTAGSTLNPLAKGFGTALGQVVEMRGDLVVLKPVAVDPFYPSDLLQEARFDRRPRLTGALSRPAAPPKLGDSVVAFGTVDATGILDVAEAQVNYLQVVGQLTEASGGTFVVTDRDGLARRCVLPPEQPRVSQEDSQLERPVTMNPGSMEQALAERIRWEVVVEGEAPAGAVDNILAWGIHFSPPRYATPAYTSYELNWIR